MRVCEGNIQIYLVLRSSEGQSEETYLMTELPESILEQNLLPTCKVNFTLNT